MVLSVFKGSGNPPFVAWRQGKSLRGKDLLCSSFVSLTTIKIQDTSFLSVQISFVLESGGTVKDGVLGH
jgi:hypothetical protein